MEFGLLRHMTVRQAPDCDGRPPYQDLGSAQDLNGKHIEIRAGMSQGLPLADPSQQGPLVAGKVWQAYGNWIGTKQTVDMQIVPDTGTPSAPKNFSFNWKAGTPLSTMLSNVFNTVYPNVPQNINISPNLVLNHDEPGYYGTLTQFAQTVYRLSKSINTDPSYPGVHIAFSGQDIKVWDGTVTPQVKQIRFQDLIGQPTWFQPATISVKTVMRGDLDIGDVIYLPPTAFSVRVESQSQAFLPGSQVAGSATQYPYRKQDSLTFSGNFKITRLEHYGNFRQSDAESWNTTMVSKGSRPKTDKEVWRDRKKALLKGTIYNRCATPWRRDYFGPAQMAERGSGVGSSVSGYRRGAQVSRTHRADRRASDWHRTTSATIGQSGPT